MSGPLFYWLNMVQVEKYRLLIITREMTIANTPKLLVHIYQ